MRQEVQFQKIMLKKGSIKRAELFKLNGLTLQDFSVSLAAILDQDTIIEMKIYFLNKQIEIMEIILNDYTEEKQAAFSVQDPMAVVWDNNDHTRE